MTTELFPHVVRDKAHKRNGQRCAIIGKNGTQLVQARFEDGFTAIVRRNALRRKPPAPENKFVKDADGE